jgi:hypothetical protein
MQIRMIFHLVNGETIESDWKPKSHAFQIETLYRDHTVPYFVVPVQGEERYIMLNALAYFYYRYQDEKKEIPF